MLFTGSNNRFLVDSTDHSQSRILQSSIKFYELTIVSQAEHCSLAAGSGQWSALQLGAFWVSYWQARPFALLM